MGANACEEGSAVLLCPRKNVAKNGGVPTGEKSEKVGGKPPMGEKPYQESLPAPRATMLS